MRLRQAREFLQDNPQEQQTTGKQHSGQNKILKDYHITALQTFICQLVRNFLQPTFQLIYNVICAIKRSHDKRFKAPSISWFSKWWKQSRLHQIKTKPLAWIRLSAQDAEEVRKWFKDYRATLQKYKIKKQNIINFDKAGFRIGCPKGQYILVLEHIKEVYP